MKAHSLARPEVSSRSHDATVSVASLAWLTDMSREAHLSHSALQSSRRCSCTVQSVCRTGRRSHIHTAAGSRPRTGPLHTLCKHAAQAGTREKANTHHDVDQAQQEKTGALIFLLRTATGFWTQYEVSDQRWWAEGREGKDIPATGLEGS